MWKKIRCFFGLHEWVSDGLSPTGFASCGWDLQPTREMYWNQRCVCCGNTRKRSGYVRMGDRRWSPELYDESGWPIDESTGQRMPIRD